MIKKLTSIFLCFCTLLLAVACAYPPGVKKKMLEYYNNDKNYEEIIGRLKHKEILGKGENSGKLEIILEPIGGEIQKYLSEDKFVVYCDDKNTTSITNLLSINDEITITTSSFIFYGEQKHPVLSLKKGEIVYLSFEEGKGALLNWVETLP